MDQATRNLWIAPVITGFAGNLLAGLVLIYVTALLTGHPFSLSLAWIGTILLVKVPLWVTLLVVAAATPVAVLYLRERARKRTELSASANLASVANPEKEEGSAGHLVPAPKIPLKLMQPGSSEGHDHPPTGGAILIDSPDDLSVRIQPYSLPNERGVRLTIDNNRLDSIHQIRVIISAACSFDARHDAFRETSINAVVLNRPNLIRPSSSGEPVPLIRKEPAYAHLVVGENPRYSLVWPENDKSEIQRWRLSIRVSGANRPVPLQSQPVPLKELFADLLVFWNSTSNEFSIEGPKTGQAPPAASAAFLTSGADGVSRAIVRQIMCGQDRLLAYKTAREGLPGARFLIVRERPDRQPQSMETSDRVAANATWNELYQEWKKRGFGGASGTGLDGEPPF
jgi:membrane protein implicated in regulation of membrane protease activity